MGIKQDKQSHFNKNFGISFLKLFKNLETYCGKSYWPASFAQALVQIQFSKLHEDLLYGYGNDIKYVTHFFLLYPSLYDVKYTFLSIFKNVDCKMLKNTDSSVSKSLLFSNAPSNLVHKAKNLIAYIERKQTKKIDRPVSVIQLNLFPSTKTIILQHNLFSQANTNTF